MGHSPGYEARGQAGGWNILISKSVRLQTEYMGTWKTRITVPDVPMDMNEDRMRPFFAQYGQVNKVSAVMSKSGIATGEWFSN